jgi:membrane fusion protein, heavy metal efflux system
MKINYKTFSIRLFILTITAFVIACKGGDHDQHRQADNDHHEDGRVIFTEEQFKALKMEVGELPMRNMSGTIQVNGILEVPPQNEAIITSIIGANINSIQVIEGDEVKKGQVLAYLTHPNLIRLQSEYLESYNKFQFTSQEYQRQTRLYKEEVGSGKVFQQVQAEYNAAQGMVKSLASQLRLLGLNTEEIEKGNFNERVAIRSPISGSIVDVLVKNGQYVQPEKELFEIINTDHIHIKLMVFERDVHQIEKGQRVRFSLSAKTADHMYAEIFSVSKKFEQDTKAVQVHAEIQGDYPNLVPGMYVKGIILKEVDDSYALPESALARDGNRRYAFLAEKSEGNKWSLAPIEVVAGESMDGWVKVDFLQEIPADSFFALNNGYYIMAEMKKGELEHDH